MSYIRIKTCGEDLYVSASGADLSEIKRLAAAAGNKVIDAGYVFTSSSQADLDNVNSYLRTRIDNQKEG
jgi:hypothetical protein